MNPSNNFQPTSRGTDTGNPQAIAVPNLQQPIDNVQASNTPVSLLDNTAQSTLRVETISGGIGRIDPGENLKTNQSEFGLALPLLALTALILFGIALWYGLFGPSLPKTPKP